MEGRTMQLLEILPHLLADLISQHGDDVALFAEEEAVRFEDILDGVNSSPVNIA